MHIFRLLLNKNYACKYLIKNYNLNATNIKRGEHNMMSIIIGILSVICVALLAFGVIFAYKNRMRAGKISFEIGMACLAFVFTYVLLSYIKIAI